ncbi:hypothetical protein Tco_0121120, partial [Tanacetum coccineum]
KIRNVRVLVEIEANKGLHDSIEINYVFGHSSFICNVRPTTVEEIEKTKTKINTDKGKDGFEEVRNRRDKGKENRVPNTPAENEIENDKDKLKGKDVIDGEPPDLEKVWNIGRSNVNELRRSANKYVVLSKDNDESVEKQREEIMIDKRLIMDEFVKKKLRENENSDEEDVCENAESAVQSVITDEVSGKGDGMGNIC